MTLAGMHTLYSMQFSGNCYKVRLLMHELGIPFRIVDFEKGSGQTTSAEFRALNPNAQVPLLVLPDGRPLAESGAMLMHLAEGSDLIPADRYERALCWQWMFFEQYSHEPVIAVARNWLSYIPGGRETMAHRIEEWRVKGNRVLAVMEGRLREAPFFAGDAFSIADIALYAYTHVADEGGFDLTRYLNITAWMARVRAQPGHVAIDHTF